LRDPLEQYILSVYALPEIVADPVQSDVPDAYVIVPVPVHPVANATE
jgi:hypothetical protein